MAISDVDRPDAIDNSDLSLIHRTRMGDTGAYGLLHDRHVGAAHALAWRMSRSPADADDLVSEGFARVLGALQRGSGPEVAFRPYLLSTIRRLAYDRTDREAREAPTDLSLDEAIAVSADPVIVGFERDSVAAAFASLPERWRMVLWHTEVEGESPAEISELLGIKPNAVAALAYRAREGLRQAYLGQHASAAAVGGDRCRLTLDRLPASVRGGLSPAHQAAVREHLDQCDDCRAAYLELASVNTSMRSAVGLAVLGPALAGYLAERAHPTAPALVASGGVATALASRLRRAGLPARVMAVAAAIGLVVAGTVVAASRPPAEPVAVGADVIEQGAGAAPDANDPDRMPIEGVVVDRMPIEGSASRPSARSRRTAADAADSPAAREARETSTVDTSDSTSTPDASPSNPARPTTSEPSDPRPEPPPTTGAPVTAPPPTAPPPTSPPPPASELTVAVASAGGLVANRSGVLVADVGNVGEGTGTAARAQFDIDGGVLRGRPHVAAPAGDATAGAGLRTAPVADGWKCGAETPSRLVCTTDRVEAGSSSSIYIPISVRSRNDPVRVTGSVTGADGQPAGRPPVSVDLPVRATGMATRFATVEHGAVVSTGNTLVSCDLAVRGCANARAGIGPDVDNGETPMVPVDVDGNPATANSSAADLVLPPGSKVVSAQLYWGSDLAAGADGEPAPDPADADWASVRPPAGAAVEVEAERVDRVGSRYQAVADVTELVDGAGAGSWTVGGVQLGTGFNAYGGWSLVVVVHDASAPLRSMVVLDGLSVVDSSPAATDTFEVGGFKVPAAGTAHATLDLITYEGDRGMTGDQLMVGGRAITDPANPKGDSFNSSACTVGVDCAGRSPSFVNLFGLDIDRFELADVLPGGATSTRISLSTTQDEYLPGVAAVMVDQ